MVMARSFTRLISSGISSLRADREGGVLAPMWIRIYLLMCCGGPRFAKLEQSLRWVCRIEEEDGADGPVLSWCRRSERQLVVRDDHPLGWRGLASVACRVLDVVAVDGEDDVTHFVDELEYGERCLG